MDRLTFYVDGAPDAEWQVWYEDTFDRETPRQVDVEGKGLAAGLVELWRRHLRSGISADGRPTFSRFNLWWKQARRGVAIAPERDGLVRLRGWIVAESHPRRGLGVQDGDAELLALIASTHSLLVVSGGVSPSDAASRPILAAAAAARVRADFERQLAALVADHDPGAVGGLHVASS